MTFQELVLKIDECIQTRTVYDKSQILVDDGLFYYNISDIKIEEARIILVTELV